MSASEDETRIVPPDDAAPDPRASGPDAATWVADSVGAMAHQLIGALRPDEVLPDSTVPTRIGRYDVERELGRGGMGVVYLARDPELERDVAIKIISSFHELADDDRRRFHREARVGTRLTHQGIVRHFDVGEHDERPFLVMDYVRGQTLRAAIDEGLSLSEGVRALGQVAEALAYAHAQNLVHRDVKPENILLRADDGRAQLTDFGLVLETEGTRKTKQGMIMGTPVYMSPEQGRGEPGPAADVYSVGAVLYELLSGRPPFKGGDIRVLLQRIVREQPKPPSHYRAGAPPGLEALALKCLEKDPTQRPSARQLARSLSKGRPTTRLTDAFTERLERGCERSPRITLAVLIGTALCLAFSAWLVLGA